MKWKSGMNDNEQESHDRSKNHGYTNVMNGPIKTPMSAKGVRTYNKSKVPKEGRSLSSDTHLKCW